TLTNVTGLSLSVSASTMYGFHCLVMVRGGSNTTNGYKWTITFPTSPTRIAFSATITQTSTSTNTWSGQDIGTYPVIGNVSTGKTMVNENGTANVDYVISIDGLIKNSTNAGTIQYQQAENSAVSATSVTVRAGSWCQLNSL